MKKITASVLSSLLLFSFALAGCSNSPSCDEKAAYNKMLAINKISAHVVAKGGQVGATLGAAISTEAGAVSELIAKKDYAGACAKADELAKKLGVDLDKEQQGMISYEQLQADGGKGSGSCSVGDAAKKQMEVHELLQAEVTAGRRDSEVFKTFNQDTAGFGEMLATNPSAACDMLEKLKEKYNLKK